MHRGHKLIAPMTLPNVCSLFRSLSLSPLRLFVSSPILRDLLLSSPTLSHFSFSVAYSLSDPSQLYFPALESILVFLSLCTLPFCLTFVHLPVP